MFFPGSPLHTINNQSYIYRTLGTILSALCQLTHLIFTTTLRDWYSYYPYLIAEETEALRIYVTYQGHKNRKGQAQDLRTAAWPPEL